MIYFGFASPIFCAFLGYFIGTLNLIIKHQQRSKKSENLVGGLCIVLLFRAAPILVEPPVGFAYIVDMFILLAGIGSAHCILYSSSKRRQAS